MSILHDKNMYLFSPTLSIEFIFHDDSIIMFIVSYKSIGEPHYEQV